jgi:hypothetical protein
MEPDVKARLEAILANVRRLRSNIYPSGWTADPLYKIEQDLQSLLIDLGYQKPTR